jgi:hypothetical protein
MKRTVILSEPPGEAKDLTEEAMKRAVILSEAKDLTENTTQHAVILNEVKDLIEAATKSSNARPRMYAHTRA